MRCRAISLDDHPITGEVTFDYAGAVPEPDAEDQGTPADPDSEAPSDERALLVRLWPLLLLAVVAAAGIAVAVQAFRSTRTSAEDS